ncbi:MAG: ATP-binding protein [Acidaminococcaceae bacterium]|nr:ATP-binding protein [Acidaminococcaceae bacterium]
MSIRRKLTIFVVLLTVIPMCILLLASHFAFNKQIELNEKTYLNIAMKTARNSMFNRAQGLRQTGMVLAQSPSFQKLIDKRDEKGLDNALDTIKINCPYADYAVIVGPHNELLAKLSPSMVYQKNSRFGILLDNVHQAKKAIFSKEVFALNQLFLPNSLEYNEYIVAIKKPKVKEKDYLDKALMGTTIVPIVSKADGSTVIGSIILGDVANHDDYFPQYYTDYVKESYLAISVDGIRITSNINAESGGHYTGSRAPEGEEISEDGVHKYFGEVEIGDEVHIFLDQIITNYSGEEVAMIGVGIPEGRFLTIISDNNRMVLFVSLLCLVIMIIAGNWLAAKMADPIVKATNEAKALGANSLNREHYKNFNTKDEGVILLETFKDISHDLQRKEQDREETLQQLYIEHNKQKALAAQLLTMNEKLEKIVAERTGHLQRALEELHKVDAAKSQFMGNISHELRTPLNAIMGAAEILRDNILGSLNIKQNKYVESIYSSGEHLLQLINDILDISKIATGKMSLNLEKFYIKNAVQSIVNNVNSYIGKKHLNISLTINPDDFLVVADVHKIRQIFYNLLSNAVKFTPEGGTIIIEIYKREDVMEAIVKDTGIGIAEEDLERVFIEFEQVDSSYCRQYEGTGLGLPLVKKLVELHGGEVCLKSKLGVGTEVMFTIPLEQSLLKNNYNA